MNIRIHIRGLLVFLMTILCYPVLALPADSSGQSAVVDTQSLSSDSAFIQLIRNRIEKNRKTAVGYPVMPFGDTLFRIYIRQGSHAASERATTITRRIEKLYKLDFPNPDSIRIDPFETGIDIKYGNDDIIMSVTLVDAVWFEKDINVLAREYREAIYSALKKQIEANQTRVWLERVGLMVLIIAVLILMIALINWMFRRTANFMYARRTKFLNGISWGNYQLFTPQQHERFAQLILRIVKYFTIILVIYLSLPLLFSLFPETKLWTSTLLRWILTPAKTILDSLWKFIPNLITILIIFFFTRYAIKGIGYISREVATGKLTIRGFHQDWASPTFSIIRFLLYAFMLVVIFPYLPGSDSPAFQGVSVFLGLLLSLGSTSAISNMVAGLVITYMRPFKKGDRIRFGEITGDVIEKSILVTRLRTVKNEEITVPNATMLASHTVNYTKYAEETGLILYTTVTIGYDVPWREMHKALTDAAYKTRGVIHEPPPFVLQTSLDDFYVSYQLNAYTRDASGQAAIYSDLHQNIQDTCNERGIEIMSPHYRAQRDGNTTTIPAHHLPPGYTPPPFVVKNS